MCILLIVRILIHFGKSIPAKCCGLVLGETESYLLSNQWDEGSLYLTVFFQTRRVKTLLMESGVGLGFFVSATSFISTWCFMMIQGRIPRVYDRVFEQSLAISCGRGSSTGMCREKSC